jgi:hypothetical protein
MNRLIRDALLRVGALLVLSPLAWAQAVVDWGSCRSYCSQTEIGNALIEIHMPHGEASARGNGAAPKTLSGPPSALDITTYVDGFGRGRAITLPLVGASPTARRVEGSFATSRAPMPRRGDAPAPGLESIAVRSVAAGAGLSPLSLPRGTVENPEAPDSVVTLDQAEPGRTYFIRPAASEVDALACQAAICPMDMASPAKPTARRPR